MYHYILFSFLEKIEGHLGDFPSKNSLYSPNLLFGSLQNISVLVGLIEKLRPLYYIKRPIPLLMIQVLGLYYRRNVC